MRIPSGIETLTVSLVVFVVACSGGVEPHRVARVVVTPTNDTIALGQQVEYHAVALDASGLTVPNVSFSWTSSQPHVAPVAPTSPDDSTRATGDSVGVTKIVASAGGAHSDSATLVVIAFSVSTGPGTGLTTCAALKGRVHGWVVSVDFSYSQSASGVDTMASPNHQMAYSLQHQGSVTMKFDQYSGDSSFMTYANWSESQASDAIKGHISMLETQTDITDNDVLTIDGDGDAVRHPQFGFGYVIQSTDNERHVCTLAFAVSPSVFASIGSGVVVTNAYESPAFMYLWPVAIPDSAVLSSPLTIAGNDQFKVFAIPTGNPPPGSYQLLSGIAGSMAHIAPAVQFGTTPVRWSITAIEQTQP